MILADDGEGRTGLKKFLQTPLVLHAKRSPLASEKLLTESR